MRVVTGNAQTINYYFKGIVATRTADLENGLTGR
jgi:hypothetical protein